MLARGAGICHAQVVAGTWQGVPALPGSVCKLIMSQAWMGSSLTRVSVQANVESRMGQPWLISQHIPGLTRVSVGVIISHRNLCIWHPHSIMCHKSSKASWWRLAYPGQCTQQLHKNHEQTRTDTTGPMMRCDRRYNNTSQPWWRCRTGARRGKGKTAESGRDTRETLAFAAHRGGATMSRGSWHMRRSPTRTRTRPSQPCRRQTEHRRWL